MKAIEARDQVRLGVGRCLRLALTGMSYRMFRSGITVAILGLAVAFLVHMVAHGLMVNEAQRRAWGELAGDRAMGQVLTRLTEVDDEAAVLAGLTWGDGARLGEYRRWSGLDEQGFAAVRAAAVRLAEAEGYLMRLPMAQRSVLLGDSLPRVRFERLRDGEAYGLFMARLETLGAAVPLGSEARFRRLVEEDQPRLMAAVGSIREGHGRAIEQVRRRFGGRRAAELASDPPADLVEVLRSAGFGFEASELGALTAFARRGEDLRRLGSLVVEPSVRAAIARRTRLPVSEVSLSETLERVEDAGEARWLAEVVAQAGGPGHLDAARLLELSEGYRRSRALQSVAGDQAAGRSAEMAAAAGAVEGGGWLGLSARMRWLIVLSFLVCMVGVANAMLMSVTERFTEIATMKCLGAMDRFVMMMFVFEAVIQGVVGGLAGLVLGLVLALGRGAVELGGLVWLARGAAGELAAATALSLVVGVGLAAVAAVGPAWVAARLAPMEAMRVE